MVTEANTRKPANEYYAVADIDATIAATRLRQPQMQGELLPQVAQEMGGLSPKLEEIIRALEWSRLETLVGGAFAEFARDQIGQRAHERMIRETLGEQLIGHISRDSTAIEARERVAEVKPAADKAVTVATPATPATAAIAAAAANATVTVTVTEATPVKRGRPRKGSVRPTPVSKSPVDRQTGQSVTQMLADLPTGCSVGTKTNAQGYKSSWRGYKLHLDTACCGVVISALGC